jgi:hypothetical protein
MIIIHIELDKHRGLSVSGQVSALGVRGIVTVLMGLVSLPWLIQFAQVMGWT